MMVTFFVDGIDTSNGKGLGDLRDFWVGVMI